MSTAVLIPAAELISSKSHILPDQLEVTELFFHVPLDYSDSSKGKITLFARRATKNEVPIFPPDEPLPPKPYLAYLEGGPGFGNREPQDHPLTRPALARGYQVLYIDYRGVGLSTPVSADMLAKKGGVDEQAAYLRLMRADNSARDCEAVRKCLTKDWPENKAQWSIFGQSYGGFVSTTYLSLYPEGLRESFITGGIPPLGKTADQVYEATFRKLTQRNEAYYRKYPEDVDNLRQIATYIESQGGVKLPSGGTLTVPGLLTMGIAFGGHGGLDRVHSTVVQMKASLDQLGFLDRASLTSANQVAPFDDDIIYTILHEPIYCDGPGSASRWAAERVGKELGPYSWLLPDFKTSKSSGPLYFSGEMVYPHHFKTSPELGRLSEVAEKLAQYDDWPRLYDLEQLQRNKVPVYAAVYIEDMYVDYGIVKDVSKYIQGVKTFETNLMYHSALRSKSEEVLQKLFNLRDDVID